MTGNDVRLTTETYVGAGGRQAYPNLEPINPIHVEAGVLVGMTPFEQLNIKLREEARRIGGTHVFNIEYGEHHSDATGDVYGPR